MVGRVLRTTVPEPFLNVARIQRAGGIRQRLVNAYLRVYGEYNRAMLLHSRNRTDETIFMEAGTFPITEVLVRTSH